MITTQDILRHALEVYTFLIPCKSTITAQEFAALIRAAYDNPQTKLIAQTVEDYGATYERLLNGQTIQTKEKYEECQ